MTTLPNDSTLPLGYVYSEQYIHNPSQWLWLGAYTDAKETINSLLLFQHMFGNSICFRIRHAGKSLKESACAVLFAPHPKYFTYLLLKGQIRQ